MRDDDENDDGDDDDGYPAYSHQSYSHQVGICHSVEGWEYVTVTFPPYTKIMINTITWIHYHTNNRRTASFVLSTHIMIFESTTNIRMPGLPIHGKQFNNFELSIS